MSRRADRTGGARQLTARRQPRRKGKTMNSNQEKAREKALELKAIKDFETEEKKPKRHAKKVYRAQEGRIYTKDNTGQAKRLMPKGPSKRDRAKARRAAKKEVTS